MPSPLWIPGESPYALWLNNLKQNDPEKYKAHLAKRALKKSMKKAMQETVEAQQEKWVALFNNAAANLMQNALQNGDVSAFTAVYDRFVGKPDTNLDVTSNGQTMSAPTIIFAAEELDEWKDDQDEG